MTRIDGYILNILLIATALLMAEAHGLRIRVPAITTEVVEAAIASSYAAAPDSDAGFSVP